MVLPGPLSGPRSCPNHLDRVGIDRSRPVSHRNLGEPCNRSPSVVVDGAKSSTTDETPARFRDWRSLPSGPPPGHGICLPNLAAALDNYRFNVAKGPGR